MALFTRIYDLFKAPSVAGIISNWTVRLLGSSKFTTTLNVAAVAKFTNYSGIYETGQKKNRRKTAVNTACL